MTPRSPVLPTPLRSSLLTRPATPGFPPARSFAFANAIYPATGVSVHHHR